MRWNSDGERSRIEYEPDPPLAELVAKSSNLENAKGVTTASVNKRLVTFPQFDASKTRLYRSVVMRASNLSQDRPDLTFSAKELARDMQKPTEMLMTIVKRHGRFLKNVHDMFNCSSMRHPLETLCDWTCMVTVTMRCGSTHAKAQRAWCCCALHIVSVYQVARAILADLGMCADVVVRMDSSSGLAVGSRR